jgi:hypothetical protein
MGSFLVNGLDRFADAGLLNNFGKLKREKGLIMASNLSYGVLSSSGGFISTSGTARGAKNKATRDGYDQVYAMHAVTWAVWLVAEKAGARWISVEGSKV